jgi:hypothetical protein
MGHNFAEIAFTPTVRRVQGHGRVCSLRLRAYGCQRSSRRC